MIREQSDLPKDAKSQGYYRKNIAVLTESDVLLENRLIALQREVKHAESNTVDQTAALSDLRTITLEKFWELPDGDINRLLSRIFGSRQLVVKDKQIVGSVERSRRRNRPHFMRNRIGV